MRVVSGNDANNTLTPVITIRHKLDHPVEVNMSSLEFQGPATALSSDGMAIVSEALHVHNPGDMGRNKCGDLWLWIPA
jgi:hypothetical protein